MSALKWLKRHYVVSILVGLIAAYSARIAIEVGATRKKQQGIVLSGMRQAPVGGEYVNAYRDGSIEFGSYLLKENKKVVAAYEVRLDTLKITYAPGDSVVAGEWLVVRGEEIQRQAGLPFKTVINKLKME